MKLILVIMTVVMLVSLCGYGYKTVHSVVPELTQRQQSMYTVLSEID